VTRHARVVPWRRFRDLRKSPKPPSRCRHHLQVAIDPAYVGRASAPRPHAISGQRRHPLARIGRCCSFFPDRTLGATAPPKSSSSLSILDCHLGRLHNTASMGVQKKTRKFAQVKRVIGTLSPTSVDVLGRTNNPPPPGQRDARLYAMRPRALPRIRAHTNPPAERRTRWPARSKPRRRKPKAPRSARCTSATRLHAPTSPHHHHHQTPC
jgi:hypothetical protein